MQPTAAPGGPAAGRGSVGCMRPHISILSPTTDIVNTIYLDIYFGARAAAPWILIQSAYGRYGRQSYLQVRISRAVSLTISRSMLNKASRNNFLPDLPPNLVLCLASIVVLILSRPQLAPPEILILFSTGDILMQILWYT